MPVSYVLRLVPELEGTRYADRIPLRAIMKAHRHRVFLVRKLWLLFDLLDREDLYLYYCR